jgi:hypothetical protein
VEPIEVSFIGPQAMRLLILCILVYVVNYDSMKDIPVPNGICSSSGENRRPSLLQNTLKIAISIKVLKNLIKSVIPVFNILFKRILLQKYTNKIQYYYTKCEKSMILKFK